MDRASSPHPPAGRVPTDAPSRVLGRATHHRRRADHSRGLLLYTTLQIVTAIAAFAWVVVAFPISPVISLTQTGGREGILLGLVFWLVIGLLGGTRVERLHGHGVLTFHIPFIIASMALGGPTAGAIVAMVSTIEARELREAPWYGVLANHASLTLAAIAGGLVFVLTRSTVGGLVDRVDPQAVELTAIVAGSFVLTIVATALAAGTVVLRDRLTVAEAIRVYDSSYRITASSEVVLGWVLAFGYASIGWWATLVIASLVLVVWQGHDAREVSRHDVMTGLLTRAGFDVRLNEAIDASRRRGQCAALLAIDLDGFKAINDTRSHAVGDEVIRAVGSRLRKAIRLTDAAARRGGDEFSVLLVDLPDITTAEMLAWRIHSRLCEPIEIDHGADVAVGASIGVFFLEPTERPPSAGRLHDLSDDLMYEAKRGGGGLRVGPESAIGPLGTLEKASTIGPSTLAISAD